MPRHSVNPELHKAIDSILNQIPVIAIYHAPQECGSPFVALISQQTGQVLEKLDVPEDYYYSGQEQVETCTPVRQFTEHICQGGSRPTVDTVRVPSAYGLHPRDHKFLALKVSITGHDLTIIPTWDADVLVEEYISNIGWEYHPDKDTFSQTMESQGIPMAEWPLPVRQKTELMEFLKTVLSSYKSYKLINLIRIG